MIVFGGSDDEVIGVVWKLDMLSKTWSIICSGDEGYGKKDKPIETAINGNIVQ